MMMDDATLHSLIQSEKEHFEALEKRRAHVVLFNEPRDVLAHCDQMQSRSMRVYSALLAEKYRRENEIMKEKDCR